MEIQYEKELKFSSALEVGDNIEIGGLHCEVKKVETIFHHTPDSRIRLSLSIVGSAPKNAEVILFLNHGIPIETLK